MDARTCRNMQEHTETVINTLEMHTCRSFCIPLFLLYFALYFSIYISTLFSFFCCASRTEFRNFKWKSCLSTFLTATSTCDATATATATATTAAESASVLLLAAKLRKLLHCFKSYLECLVYLRAPQLNASIKTSFQHAENAISILISFQVGF